MKIIFPFFTFFVFYIAFCDAQPGPGVNLENIPATGTMLDRGWKFHAGDNIKWAAADFDDRGWQTIFPSKPIDSLPQLRQTQIGWFRLKLSVGKALRGKTVAFTLDQIGASEIYLNGELIRQYGKVSGNYNHEQLYDPQQQPLTIQLGNQPQQVLAVHYSYTAQNLYTGYGQSAFNLSISSPAKAWDSYTNDINNYSYRSLMTGVFLILSILHFFIYLSYRQRKINLYLSVYTLFQSCVFVNGLLGTQHSSNATFFLTVLFYISAPLAQIFFLLTVYDLFNRPKNLWFRLLVLLCILIIPFEFFRDYGSTNRILDLFGILIYIEIIRISIIAFRKKQQGSALFLAGQSIGLLFFCSFVFIDSQPDLMKIIEVDIAFLTPAVVVSILLAREFAQNNISLQQQLEEVKKLSEKNLAQEQEKQQILALQNETLEKQVEHRTQELSKSLIELKQAQSQLIQSEKMASLGELTAGIAHEIQNPLNFVNNFSDVNREMLEELKAESEKPKAKRDDQVELGLINDLIENEQKINHHGKRADAIVKGMLQHSQTGSGAKEPTNINALADEYLRLSYHGFRSKDKTFNAEMSTHFDENIPRITVVAQDIGRVLLNLFNNAFYSVKQKIKTAGTDYKPMVSVSTSLENGQVVIKVKDNGTGIPDAIKEKIMQPFFTTKPTGEGTGLGLSLSYDIVVKGHGGSLTLDIKEREFTTFMVTLPI